MQWFEDLTGFAEAGYESTRARLAVDGTDLVVHLVTRSTPSPAMRRLEQTNGQSAAGRTPK